MNSIKIFLGNIYLTIPHVFAETGWLGGIMMYTLIAALNAYQMIEMIKVAEEVGGKGQISGYSELAMKVYGRKNKILVDVMLYISQFALVVGYLYFMAEQIVHIADVKFQTKLD